MCLVAGAAEAGERSKHPISKNQRQSWLHLDEAAGAGKYRAMEQASHRDLVDNIVYLLNLIV